jgi:hypothetical protein
MGRSGKVATVGERYEAVFSVKQQRPAVWRLAAQFLPEDGIRYKGSFADYIGLRFDPKQGRLSGVPTRAGVYTLQLQAAWSVGPLADAQTYMLTVRPRPKPD